MDKKTIYIFLLLFFFLLLIQYSSRMAPPPQEKKEKVLPSTVSLLPEGASIEESQRISQTQHWGILEISDWGGILSCRLKDFKEREHALKNLQEEKKRLEASFSRLPPKERAILSYQITKLEKSYQYFKESKGKEVEIISFPEIFWGHLPPYFTYTDSRGTPLLSDTQRSPYTLRKEGKKIILEKRPGRVIAGSTLINDWAVPNGNTKRFRATPSRRTRWRRLWGPGS